MRHAAALMRRCAAAIIIRADAMLAFALPPMLALFSLAAD